MFKNNSSLPFVTYQIFFMRIWSSAVAQGYSTLDAKELAQMEWNDFVVKNQYQ